MTYCTNKELAFDYLRDRIVLARAAEPAPAPARAAWRARHAAERLVLRGLHFAIVDEADSVLVDEARTPLIISGGGSSAEQRLYETGAGSWPSSSSRSGDFTIDWPDATCG